VLDGLRPARDGTTALGEAPMSLDEMDRVMACGHVPRSRAARPKVA
jgi:hypothetical protein